MPYKIVKNYPRNGTIIGSAQADPWGIHTIYFQICIVTLTDRVSLRTGVQLLMQKHWMELNTRTEVFDCKHLLTDRDRKLKNEGQAKENHGSWTSALNFVAGKSKPFFSFKFRTYNIFTHNKKHMTKTRQRYKLDITMSQFQVYKKFLTGESSSGFCLFLSWQNQIPLSNH